MTNSSGGVRYGRTSGTERARVVQMEQLCCSPRGLAPNHASESAQRKDTIEWTGGTIKLSAKMKIVGGRLMVPSGLLDALRSAPAAKKAPPARRK